MYKYIVDNLKPLLWRPNEDMTVYISFNPKLLYETYGKEIDVEQKDNQFIANENAIFEQYDKNVIEVYKTTLENEWGKRAGIPMKFIDNATPDFIRSKNVLFIAAEIPTEDTGRYTSGTTHSFFSPHTTDKSIGITKYCEYRLILMLPVTKDKIKNFHINTLLHEVGHAFELKHPLNYDDNERGPFKQIDCSKTIMAYDTDCEQVLEAKRKNLGYTEISSMDFINKKAHKYIKVLNAYPTSLGRVDIEAAKHKINEWKQRQFLLNSTNLIENKTEKKESHTELYRCINTASFLNEITIPNIQSPISSATSLFGLFFDAAFSNPKNHQADYSALGEEVEIDIKLRQQTGISLSEKLNLLCGKNNIEKHPEKVEKIKDLYLRVLKNKCNSTTQEEFFECAKIDNRNLRFKSLYNLALKDAANEHEFTFGSQL